MSERPILFSATMVRALLDGSKTQTRRALTSQPHEETGALSVGPYNPTVIDRHGDEQPGPERFGVYSSCGDFGLRCPYGQPGDQLWVRETWAPWAPHPANDDTDSVIYRATDQRTPDRWRPSIHMPRWASRIQLEITDVRVERLQAITEADAAAEGVHTDPACPAYDAYAHLWNEINGPGAWEANPWVWVVSFKRLKP